MKKYINRRGFITKGAAAGLGLMGCGARIPRRVKLEKKLAPFTSRPEGVMPETELGTTGIKISRFGFGSHIRKDMPPFKKQREYMIREAHDLGIKVFDVYDFEQECYQYEPMGKFLAPVINDVVISISILPYDGRTLEQELERDLRVFGRDHIDMVRCHAPNTDSAHWHFWDSLFKWKEEGKIRAVGIPIHDIEHIDFILDAYPIDYVIFPYNFYHNICWLEERPDDFDSLPARLRAKGVGVVTMKAFAGDYLAKPFIDIARYFTDEPDIQFPQAALRYVINSGIKPDTTFTGMYNLSQVYEDIAAYYKPEMSDEERNLLNNIKRVAKRSAKAWLPEHYKWLENWAQAVDNSKIDSNTG